MRHLSNSSLKSLLLILLLTGFAIAIASAQQEHGVSDVVYTFTGDALEGPEQLEAGFHTITLQNDTEGRYAVLFLRLKAGATGEDIVGALDEMRQAYEEDGDVAATTDAILDYADMLGGIAAFPGEPMSVGVTLEPDRYAFTGQTLAGETTYKLVEVNPSTTAAQAPTPDLTVNMLDFAFAFPSELRAGPQTWEIVNVGEQIHQLELTRVVFSEGKTIADLLAFLETFEGEEPFEETEDIVYVPFISSGYSNFVSFDLEPGTYLALCFVPDHKNGTGVPHAALGMISTFTVVGD